MKASNAKMDKIMELMRHNNTHVMPTTDLHVHTLQSDTTVCHVNETMKLVADALPPPHDQAVPSLSVEEDTSGFLYEGMEPDNQRKRCHVSEDGDVNPIVTDKSTISNRTTTQATTNTMEQDSTDNDEPIVSPPTMTINGNTTSQGSCSTQYDIDLTQDSPSMCSQIISQRLEQCNSSQRTSHPLTAVNTSQAQVEGSVPKGSFPKRQKIQPSTPLRQRGGRRVVRRKGGMISTSLSKRRSQRIQKSAVSSGSPLVMPGYQDVRRKKAVDSPMNALCDSFYSQTSTAQASQCVSQSEHIVDVPAAISTHPISTGPLATGVSESDCFYFMPLSTCCPLSFLVYIPPSPYYCPQGKASIPVLMVTPRFECNHARHVLRAKHPSSYGYTCI